LRTLRPASAAHAAAPGWGGHEAFPASAPVRPPGVSTWQSVLVVLAAVTFGTDLAVVLLSSTGEHSPQVRMLYLLIYAVFGLLFVCSKDAVRTLVTAAPVLVLVLALPALSMLWSVDPGETMERSVALLGTSLFGAYLGWRFTLGRIIFLLAIAMSIAVSLSMAVIILDPSIGVKGSGQGAGAWLGTSLHKNALGATAALSCLLIGYAITDSRGWRRLAFCLALLISLALLIGSRSISSLLATAAIGALAFWARRLQRSPKELSVLTLIVAIALVASAIQLVGAGLIESTLAFFGKNSNLSSRVPLWSLLWFYIEKRFWLGFGYEGFWQPGAPAMRDIEAQLYFTPFYAHNGLLETWLNGGAVLVVLVLLLLCITVARSLVLYIRWRDLAISSFPLFYSVYFLMSNFAESSVLARNSLSWAVLVAVAVFVAKWVRLRHS
jgi:O-antigen ligase